MTTLYNYPLVLAAIAVWREAQDQPYSAMLGALCVMRNRVTPTKNIVEVITARHQFSSMTFAGDPNLIKWPEMNDIAFARCCQAVDAVFGMTPIADTTGGATFYFSPPLTSPPTGWGPVAITVKFGDLTFCKSVPPSFTPPLQA